jgi:O-antigen/teichoic acid export membrane protein
MNKHAWDTLSLIFGVTFLAAVGAWLVSEWLTVDLPPAGWLLAAGLVLFGVLGLISTVLQRRGQDA